MTWGGVRPAASASTAADVAADANDPSNDPFRLVPRREPNERDNAVARTQLAAVQFEREYLEGDLDDHDSFLGSDSISEPSDGLGPSSDDEEEERAANDRRGQLTNLTREILHESPHYRELVAHYRRRMGDPDYDPDASEERQPPLRQVLIPIDGNAQSEYMVDWALANFCRAGDQINILHVIPK